MTKTVIIVTLIGYTIAIEVRKRIHPSEYPLYDTKGPSGRENLLKYESLYYLYQPHIRNKRPQKESESLQD